jgi:hypothetical protein
MSIRLIQGQRDLELSGSGQFHDYCLRMSILLNAHSGRQTNTEY